MLKKGMAASVWRFRCVMDFSKDQRFIGLKPLKNRIWLASPTMYDEEEKWVHEAFRTNWVTTSGDNINDIEFSIAELVGVRYAVALSSGTAALHLAIKLAAEKLYGQARPDTGTLAGHKVFCSDVTFDATVNPVAYEDGEAVFIDTECDTWNMSPKALERAFRIYPDVKLIVLAHLYGTPGKMDEIKRIADEHGALIVEDAAESFGAKYKHNDKWCETGSLGDYNTISFNGNKIITGSSGGMFLTNEKDDADKVRKWSTQSREAAPWYQHEEIGYNYRMSNIVAGIIRGQLPHLSEHVKVKQAIYERYKDGFKDLPVKMNPYDDSRSKPNFWLSCMTINPEAMVMQVRGDDDYLYTQGSGGKSSPQEILEALAWIGAEGRPIWKPMHMQPIYRGNAFITRKGSGRGKSNAYISSQGEGVIDVGADIFQRGLCLPSDVKMKPEEQEIVIEVVRRCFM